MRRSDIHVSLRSPNVKNRMTFEKRMLGLNLFTILLCFGAGLCSSLVFVYISMLFGEVVVGELTFEFWLLLQLFFFTCFLNSNHFGFSCLVVLLSILFLFVVVVVGMF